MKKSSQDDMIDKKINKLININDRQEKNIKLLINNLYAQLESFSWLQRTLAIQGGLPPLRGWPISPDFLLRLHNWIRKNKPQVIVETGSGASTLVIADALRQNGKGQLFSFEHLKKYGDQAWQTLVDENLTRWVDLRVGYLVAWNNDHLNPENSEKPSIWYPLNLNGIHHVDLLIVDGPPGGSCHYARYPAVPALFNRLSANAEIWMDDANRQDEKDICESWAELYGFDLEYIPLEKGLARLVRSGGNQNGSHSLSQPDFFSASNSVKSEQALGLDFSLPEDRQ